MKASYRLKINPKEKQKYYFLYLLLFLYFLIVCTCYKIIFILNFLIVLLGWKYLYTTFYNIYTQSKITLLSPTLEDKSGEEHDFFPVTHIENYQNETSKYYEAHIKKNRFLINIIGLKRVDSKANSRVGKNLYRVISYNTIFSSLSHIFLFFIPSFFTLVFLYYLSLLSFHDVLHYFEIGKYIKEIYIEIAMLIILFPTYLYVFIKHMNIDIDDDIHNIKKNIHNIKNDFIIITLPDDRFSNINTLLDETSSIKENFDKIMLNILQISIPLFFLSYISIVIFLNKECP